MFYKETEELTKEVFQNPGSEYRAAPFWAWNCKMTREEIDCILDVVSKMGMGGAHIHCRTGMDNPYMGEEFLQLVKYSNEKSKEKGMLTWLYDEDRWPSGAAGGLVTKDHQFRMRFLLFTPYWQENINLTQGNFRSAGQAVRSNEFTLLGRYQVKLKDGYLSDYAKIDIDSPLMEGYQEWFAYLEVSGDNPWFNNEAYLNTLDQRAVEQFIRVTHEQYYRVLGQEFGKSIPSIFTDEPQFAFKTTLGYADERSEVIIPYTDDLEDTFKVVYGSSLLAHLPELFWELGEDEVSVIRYEYHDHIAERFAGAYADTIGTWCKNHGLMLTGHMMKEPTMESQTEALGEAMRSYRSFQLPGVDMLCDKRELSTVKQAQSAAHQYGCPGVLSEMYGVTNWDFDFRGHKLQGDWQAALGVTVRVPHLTWTTMEGEAKRDYPATIGYQSPWYEEYPLIENHFARVNSAMTRGVPHVRIGVIHPIESYWLFWGPKEQTASVRQEMDDHFANLIEWLLYATIDFDFIAESLLPDLNKGQDEDAKLKVGAMKYDVILVPNCMTLRNTTLDILEKFRARGGRIIFLGKIPVFENAKPSERGRKLAEQTERIEFGKRQIIHALKPYREIIITRTDGSTATNLIYQMRREKDCRWLFLSHVQKMSNSDIPTQEQLKITISGEWIVTLYDTMNGEIRVFQTDYENGNTMLNDTLFDHDSRLLYLKPGRSDNKKDCVKKTIYEQEIVIPYEVKVVCSEPNVSVLDLAEYRFDDGEWNAEDEVLRIDNKFRKLLGYPLRMDACAQPWINHKNEKSIHTLSLRYTIIASEDLGDVLLALENSEITRIYLDGVKVKNTQKGWYVDRHIHTISLQKIAKGHHILQVEIPYNSKVNTECMFLLGDFSVRVIGKKQILYKKADTAFYMDETRQGYPFYGGNLTYRIPFKSCGGEVQVEATMFRSPVIKVAVDRNEIGYIFISPYKLSLGQLTAGEHMLELTIFGSRVNTFGTIHNCNQTEFWYGPNAWRTIGAKWSYEYQLKPTGLLKAPILTEIVESRDV